MSALCQKRTESLVWRPTLHIPLGEMKEGRPESPPAHHESRQCNLFLESRRDGRANGVVNSLQPSADENHASDAYY